MAYLDAHANGQYERVHKSMGSDEITTVYFGEGPPDKYQTTGRIDSTDWQTGQPKTDINVIVCTHIQVVYRRGQHHLTQHLRADDVFLRFS